MPVHDWTRVTPGIFHHFHQNWMVAISAALNSGLLPSDYYALAEQITGDFGPDVLALQLQDLNGPPPDQESPRGATAVLTAVALQPPRAELVVTTEMDHYIRKQTTVVVRHSGGDRIVALLEIVSPGNKASRAMLRSFVEKAAEALVRGYHISVVDLLPPTPRDPQGIHGAIWEEIADASYRQPPTRPLTLAAYDAGPPKTAYIQTLAVGDALPELSLFLLPQRYVRVPLESTYATAFQHTPQRWRRVLEASA